MYHETAPRPLIAPRFGVIGRLALTAALLALISGTALAQAGVGDPAPDFTLTGNDGVEYTLSDAFGDQVQMLYFIGYSWGSCIGDGPSVEALYQSHDSSVLRAFALDVWNGSDANNDLFQNVAGISFPVLLQAGYLQAPDQYDTGRHTVFVIDGEGIVRYRGPVNTADIAAALDEAVADLDTQTAVGDTPQGGALLAANYPNPFNPSTSIPYEVPVARDGAPVRLEILDLRGRVVDTLVAGSRPAGRHVAIFTGVDARGKTLPSGAYLARLRVGDTVEARVMTLVK